MHFVGARALYAAEINGIFMKTKYSNFFPKYFYLLALALLVFSCDESSAKISFDKNYNFSKLKSIAVVTPYYFNDDQLSILIRDSISRELMQLNISSLVRLPDWSPLKEKALLESGLSTESNAQALLNVVIYKYRPPFISNVPVRIVDKGSITSYSKAEKIYLDEVSVRKIVAIANLSNYNQVVLRETRFSSNIQILGSTKYTTETLFIDGEFNISICLTDLETSKQILSIQATSRGLDTLTMINNSLIRIFDSFRRTINKKRTK